MADRRCPYCGELVPSNSVTCPKCYKKIPVEPEPVRDRSGGDQKRQRRGGSRKIAILLSIIPAFVGLLGLGLIYRNPRQKRGYIVLLLGLLFFVAAVFLTFGIFTIVFAVPCWIMYVLLFLGCLALASLDDMVFKFHGVGPF